MKKLSIIVLFVLLFAPVFAVAQLRDCQLKGECPNFGMTAPSIPEQNFIEPEPEPIFGSATVPVEQMTLDQIQQEIIKLMQQVVNLLSQLIALQSIR